MSIRKDIAALKRTVTPDESDEDALRMLVDIVARRDAMFWPWRDYKNATGQAAYVAILELQRGYLSRSVGIEARASGEREWKQAHYNRRKLVELGYATAARARSQITGLYITERGDAVARAIISGSALLPYQTAIIYEVLSRRGTLSESKLFGRELYGDPSAWDDLTELCLPLLHRGMIKASFDTVGRVFYGFALSDWPEVETSDEPVRDWAEAFYWQSYNAERQRLDSLTYDGPEVYIPLPASSVGNCLCSPDIGREYTPGELKALLQTQQSNEEKDHAENPQA
jgi:hypothetical protein